MTLWAICNAATWRPMGVARYLSEESAQAALNDLHRRILAGERQDLANIVMYVDCMGLG